MKSKTLAALLAENAALIAALKAEQAKTAAAYGLPQPTQSK